MWFGLPDQAFMGLTDIADHTARIDATFTGSYTAVADQLAEYVAHSTYEAIPSDVRDEAKAA